MARNNEPAFRRKTPLLICSIRTEIPYPCIGSSANVFRMSISRVPWTRSLGLSGINLLPLGYQGEHTPLILVVKRRGWATAIFALAESKDDGHSLYYGLSTSPTASQASVPGVATETQGML